MDSLVCVDARGWDAVVRGAARYLDEGAALVVHVVDDRVSRGYDLTVRGLLGRRAGVWAERMAPVSEAAARELLAEAGALLEQLCPRVEVRTLLLRGTPNETLIRIARERRVESVFVGRGTPESGSVVTVSGVVTGWRRNRLGDLDGLYLDDGAEVRFPPHRAADVRSFVQKDRPVEVIGTWRGSHVHAYRIVDSASGSRVQAHEKPSGESERMRLGHTSRFVVDHVSCDAVVLRP